MNVRTRPAPTGTPSLRQGALLLAAVGFAVAVGVAIAVEPWISFLVLVALAVIAFVALHPPRGAALLIVASLLIAGMDRDVLVPVLRPHEVVLILVALGLLTHLVLGVLVGRVRLALRFDRIDVAIIFMALCGSVLPLAMMVLRDRDIARDDILYALQLWKLYAVFVIVRVGVRTPQEVRRCLWITMGAALVVGIVGVLQSLELFGVTGLLEQYYTRSGEDAAFARSRASSTVSSPFSVGDVMTFSMAIAGGLLVRRHPHRLLLASLAAIFLLCAMASGQFSIFIGILVGVVAFGLVTQRLGRSLAGLMVMGVVAAVALQPVIQNRLRSFDNSSGLPRSWEGRLENLETFFLPVLVEDYNWITGVRPWARVPAPEAWRDFVYIESGHVWLLWTGGIAFFVAFHIFLAVGLPTMARVARERSDAVGAAAAAGFTALAVIGVLMVFDVHLTLRGAGELSFTLLALGMPRDEEPP